MVALRDAKDLGQICVVYDDQLPMSDQLVDVFPFDPLKESGLEKWFKQELPQGMCRDTLTLVFMENMGVVVYREIPVEEKKLE